MKNVLNSGKGIIFGIIALMAMSCNMGQSLPVSEDAKSLQAPEDKALVYFVRPSKVGGLIAMGIFVNGKEIGETKGKTFIYGFFDPGQYTFMSKAENKKEMSMALEANQTYYIKQSAKMGFAFARTDIERVPDAEGLKALSKCRVAKLQGEPYFKP